MATRNRTPVGRIAARRHAGGTFAFLTPDGPPRHFEYFATARAAQGAHLAVLAAPAPNPDARSRESTGRSLSEREREVLTLIASGETGLAISRALNISPATVETHVRHCMKTSHPGFDGVIDQTQGGSEGTGAWVVSAG
jgi:DNA-binding CsgD family transcriptional regulator